MVVLPEPTRPMIATRSPGPIRNDTLRSTSSGWLEYGKTDHRRRQHAGLQPQLGDLSDHLFPFALHRALRAHDLDRFQANECFDQGRLPFCGMTVALLHDARKRPLQGETNTNNER